MSENPSLILDSTATEEIAMSKIRNWLKLVTGEENSTMVCNLDKFWKERKAECNKLEFKQIENYFTATLWKIVDVCVI